MVRYLMASIACVSLIACGSQLKVTKVEGDTGKLSASKEAKIISEKSASLKKYGGTVFVSGGDYAVDQVRALGIFSEVLSAEDLQKIVIKNGLQDRVQSVREPIGLSNLYRAYKPFLWVRFKSKQDGALQIWQLFVTDPENMDDLLVSQTEFHGWKNWSINDQTMRYPLFNALLAWSRKNP